jgi:hypothetical protein
LSRALRIPGRLHRCAKRLIRAERLITEFLRAYDGAEMGNELAAIERLRKFMSEV